MPTKSIRSGYGLLVSNARESIGMTKEELAQRIGRSVSTVDRIESETTEPSARQINALVAALPLSAEELLRAMGVNLTPIAAAKLPRRMVEAILALPYDQLRGLYLFLGVPEPPEESPRSGLTR